MAERTGRQFRDLVVWQRAMALVTDVYAATQDFPKQEQYALTDQIRRSAISVPSNIAEGQGRSTKGEFRLFLGHAKGSLNELETQLLIAARLGYMPLKRAEALVDAAGEVRRMLFGLIASMQD